MNNKEKLLNIIAELLNKEADELGNLEGKDLFEDLGFDSILTMDFLVNVEEEFGINLGEEDLIDNIHSFDGMLSLIEKYLL